MSLQAILTAQFLPPLLFAWAALLVGALALRRAPRIGALVASCALGLLVLATPLAANGLRASLEARILPPAATEPTAIVILGAEAERGLEGGEPGPLTLERLRAGAALHRATGLPILVTGGIVRRDLPPIAWLMAESLAGDFRVTTRWVEDRAGDTRGNATLSAALLRADGVGAVLLVTHAWHMRRAQEAFLRAGLSVSAAPVRLHLDGPFTWPDLVPCPDRWGEAWYMLREWAGWLVYRLRDGVA